MVKASVGIRAGDIADQFGVSGWGARAKIKQKEAKPSLILLLGCVCLLATHPMRGRKCP
jgi:hypothetical protein